LNILNKLTYILLLLFVCLFSTCSESGDGQSEATKKIIEEAPEHKVKTTPCILVQHRVADYQVWKKGFDEYDSIRQEMGINVLNIFCFKDDTNNVIFIMEVSDFQAAYSYASELTEIKGKLGVIGEPVIKILKATQYPAAQEKTTFMFIQHRVKDYKTWRKGFDGYASVRQEYGLYALNVFNVDGNPNNVLVLMEVDDFKSAMKYALSQNLRKTMEDWGVISALEITPVITVQ